MTLFAFIAPATARNVLLVLVGGCYLGYHLYHAWRRWRAEKKLKGEVEVEEKVKVRGEEKVKVRGEGGPCHPTVQQEEIVHCSPSPSTFTSSPSSACTPPQPIQQSDNPIIQQSDNQAIQQFSSLSGEELYAQARTMPHQPIPDIRYDGEYLTLLAQSAAKNYPRALAKLGDYAMRRGCNVEAYYWLWRAKRAGMGGLERMLLQVRSEWANGNFRRESANEYAGFTREQGDIGYALLCIDARHNADAAKAWLAECAPDFLSTS